MSLTVTSAEAIQLAAAIHDKSAKEVTVRGKTLPVQEKSQTKLRYVQLERVQAVEQVCFCIGCCFVAELAAVWACLALFGSPCFRRSRVDAQNPDKSTKYARDARKGSQITWFVGSGGKWGLVADGVVMQHGAGNPKQTFVQGVLC